MLSAIALGLLLASPQAKQTPPIQLPPQTPQTQQNPPVKLTDTAAAAPVVDVGVQQEAVLNITKHIAARFDPALVPVNGSWAGGQQQDIREGEVSFSVQNSVWQGKPCKFFKGVSNWEYHPNVRNKKAILKPKLYVFAQVSPEGRLLHMNTAYNGFGIAAPVQIDAIFNADSIDITRTDGPSITRTTLFPTFSMDLFSHLFDPFIRDGLVESKERQIAFLHPITGAPCVVTVSLNGRFNGKHEYREYEGYKFDVTSPDTNLKAVSLVTRQGQLLQVNLPENQDAIVYTNVSGEEEANWGKFRPGDWDKPSSQTQPHRARFHTLGVPVLLTNPSYMLLPFPLALAV